VRLGPKLDEAHRAKHASRVGNGYGAAIGNGPIPWTLWSPRPHIISSCLKMIACACCTSSFRPATQCLCTPIACRRCSTSSIGAYEHRGRFRWVRRRERGKLTIPAQ
jgi:hypothetical protein